MARGRRTLNGIVLIRQFNLAKQGGGCQGMRVVGDSGGGKQRVACVLSTQRLWRNRREPWRRANRKKKWFRFHGKLEIRTKNCLCCVATLSGERI